jgi:hypothetical protein
MCDLDPPRGDERAVIAIVRCSPAQIARWCASAREGRGIDVTFDRECGGASSSFAAPSTHENGANVAVKASVRCSVRSGSETCAFRGIEDDGKSVVVRGSVVGASERDAPALTVLGAAALKCRPIRSLEDGTAARVKQRGEEELREKRERHAKIVEVGEVPANAAEAARTPVRRELERWSRIVGASMMGGSGGDIVRLRNALAALLHERPLSRNALQECVERGYALAGRESAPNQKFTRDAIKQVSAFRSPGRYELLASVRKHAAEQHVTLTALVRDMKFKDVGDKDKAKRSVGGTGTGASAPASARAVESSVPTPPLQEPPRVLRNGVVVDLGGDRSPSIDLDPHAHVIPRSSSFTETQIVVAPRAAGDDDDAWRNFQPSPPIGIIETADEFEAIKAMYDAKYAAYLSMHARLTANANEYEALRKRDRQLAARALERFTHLRRDRYAEMRVAFDALHDELADISRAVDAYSRLHPVH